MPEQEMVAVRQLIAVNADLHTSRAELSELAVATERERMARELHDLLGRTLSLIAVKAELASGLTASGDPSAGLEMGDVQRLAREALHEVRDAITGGYVPSVDAELAAAPAVLQAARIVAQVDQVRGRIDPAHETAVAWALREAVTNVVRHSGARSCRIVLHADEGCTTLEVSDDGQGRASAGSGSGLDGLAQRVHALGGSLETGQRSEGGFHLRVQLGALAPGVVAAGGVL